MAHHQVPVDPPVCFSGKCRLRIGRSDAGPPVLGQKVLAHAREHRLHHSRIEHRVSAHRRAHLAEAPGQKLERGVERPRFQEAIETAAHRIAFRDQPGAGAPAGGRHVQVNGPGGREKFRQHVGRHDPSVQQARQPRPDAPFAELRKGERDVVIVSGRRAADAQGAIERLVDQPR